MQFESSLKLKLKYFFTDDLKAIKISLFINFQSILHAALLCCLTNAIRWWLVLVPGAERISTHVKNERVLSGFGARGRRANEADDSEKRSWQKALARSPHAKKAQLDREKKGTISAAKGCVCWGAQGLSLLQSASLRANIRVREMLLLVDFSLPRDVLGALATTPLATPPASVF